LGLKVTKTSLWRVVQARGEAIETQRQTEAEHQGRLPVRGQLIRGEEKRDQPMGVAAEGVYINLLEQGWKEVKVGTVFEITPLDEREKVQRLRRHSQPVPPDPSEIREMVKAQAISYCAHLGSVDDFEPLLWAEASRRQFAQCWETVFISDGAEWLDRLYRTDFYESTRIIDWYHACEHLAALARQASPSAARWLKNRQDDLWHGRISAIATAIHALPLPQADKDREAAYFTKHAPAMTYLLFCQQGFPLGTGMVEGAGCKGLVQGRFRQVGRRWSPAGASHLLALCCEYHSGRWSQLWAA
jgi:hypothetical protein